MKITFGWHWRALFTAALGIWCSAANATLLTSQAQLDALLGSNKVTEDFSGIKYEGDMSPGNPTDTWRVAIGPSLNSSTILPPVGPFLNVNLAATTNDFDNPLVVCIPTPFGPCSLEIEPAQGPGLVKPGINFAAATLIYNPISAFVFPLPALRALGSMEMDFSIPVNAVGVTLEGSFLADIFVSNFTETVSFYGLTNDLLSQTEVTGLDFPIGGTLFVGDHESNAIGKVIIENNFGNAGPVLANVSFGLVPEPSSLALFSVALLALGALHHRKQMAGRSGGR